MSCYVALLRGVNVSGQRRIPSKELSELFAALGYENIVTYMQSGNVVFTTVKKAPVVLMEQIEKGIKKKFGFDVSVLVIEKKEMQKIVERNPFVKVKGNDETKLHVSFLFNVPPKENLNKITSIDGGADKLVVSGKEIYLICPKGYGRTRYTNATIENKLKVKATTRNWKTVNALSELTENIVKNK